jgi:hypothetical protein
VGVDVSSVSEIAVKETLPLPNLGGDAVSSVTQPQRDLPMPADRLVRVIHALIEGLTFQRLLTPELVPDEVFYAAFSMLADKRQK